jgi:hypothetical protein
MQSRARGGHWASLLALHTLRQDAQSTLRDGNCSQSAQEIRFRAADR